MKFCKLASVAIALVLSTNVNAALISTLTSYDNTGGLIAGDHWLLRLFFMWGEETLLLKV